MRKAVELKSGPDQPEFQSSEEAAEWYDTHDTSELPPAERVQVRRHEKNPMGTVALRLSPREMAELKARAGQLGVGYTTYIRMLITRHVLKERPLGDG